MTRNSHEQRPLSSGARQDLAWWADLLPRTEGVLILDDPSRPVHHLFKDASSTGLGAFWYTGGPAQGNWRDAVTKVPQQHSFAGALPRQSAHINVSETLVI